VNVWVKQQVSFKLQTDTTMISILCIVADQGEVMFVFVEAFSTSLGNPAIRRQWTSRHIDTNNTSSAGCKFAAPWECLVQASREKNEDQGAGRARFQQSCRLYFG
jgi:hypothetical protein